MITNLAVSERAGVNFTQFHFNFNSLVSKIIKCVEQAQWAFRQPRDTPRQGHTLCETGLKAPALAGFILGARIFSS